MNSIKVHSTLVNRRGNLAQVSTGSEVFVGVYNCFCFDDMSIEVDNKVFPYASCGWVIYNLKKITISQKAMVNLRDAVKALALSSPVVFNLGSITDFMVQKYDGCYMVFLMLNGSSQYQHIQFILKNGKVYFSALRNKKSKDFFSMDGELEKVRISSTRFGKCHPGVRELECYPVEVSSNIKRDLVQSVQLLNRNEVHFIESQMFEDDDILVSVKSGVGICCGLCMNKLCLDYGNVVLSSMSINKVKFPMYLEQAGVTGYGLSYKNHFSDSYLKQLKGTKYYACLEENAFKLGYDIPYVAGPGEYIIVNKIRRLLLLAKIYKRLSNSCGLSFYSVVVGSLTFRKGELCITNTYSIASSTNYVALLQELESGVLPENNYISISGVCVLDIEEVKGGYIISLKYGTDSFSVLYDVKRDCVPKEMKFPKIGVSATKFCKFLVGKFS